MNEALRVWTPTQTRIGLTTVMLLNQRPAFLDEGVSTRVRAIEFLEQALEAGMTLEKNDFVARKSDAQNSMEFVRVGLHDAFSMRQTGIESMQYHSVILES